MCEFFDTGVADACKEPVADRVMDKERANFCGYLRISSREWVAPDSSVSDQARKDLDALFGAATESESTGAEASELDELNRLFGGGPGEN